MICIQFIRKLIKPYQDILLIKDVRFHVQWLSYCSDSRPARDKRGEIMAYDSEGSVYVVAFTCAVGQNLIVGEKCVVQCS